MKESREQIARHLNRFKADCIGMYYTIVTSAVLGNSDFRIVRDEGDEGEEDERQIVERMTGRRVPAPTQSFPARTLRSSADARVLSIRINRRRRRGWS